MSAPIVAGLQGGKWTALMAALDGHAGIVVAPADLAERVRRDRPGRDVRVDNATPGVLRCYLFENLPLHDHPINR